MAKQGEGMVVGPDTLSRYCPTHLDQTLALLTRRQLIEPVGAGYRFQVELIRRWFAQL
jgi:hypothetical protein